LTKEVDAGVVGPVGVAEGVELGLEEWLEEWTEVIVVGGAVVVDWRHWL